MPMWCSVGRAELAQAGHASQQLVVGEVRLPALVGAL